MDERIYEALRQALDEYERATNKREAQMKIMGLLLLIERASQVPFEASGGDSDQDSTDAGTPAGARKPPHCSIRADLLDLSASCVRLGFIAHRQRALVPIHI